ncbi:MAG: biotin synthase BioB [Rickettsiales bacterium]|nr:biotin synthase BioB [Rickettsiales bacterium]
MLNKIEIRNNWSFEEVKNLYNQPLNDLIFSAQQALRQYFDPHKVQLSTLLSIKTGGCPEDCAYCPQSSRYNTGLEASKLIDIDEILNSAKKAKEAGASRFCMGAAWRNPKDRHIPELQEVIKGVKSLGLETCMTLGMLTENQANKLADAGLDYYNHNIDTSEEFYSKIITTRTFQDRLETLENVRKAGMKTCCGGIVGMGETIDDRLKMLVTLANLPEQPTSVPINMLVKVEGTPLDKNDEVDFIEFVRIIAVARIIMPASYVRLSAGREEMTEEKQALCLMAGANSFFYGEKLLTTPNPSKNEDIEMLAKLGLKQEELNEYKETDCSNQTQKVA